jgi:hypothetical protein
LWLLDKLGEDSNIKAVKKGGRNTIMKGRGSKIKQVNILPTLEVW